MQWSSIYMNKLWCLPVRWAGRHCICLCTQMVSVQLGAHWLPFQAQHLWSEMEPGRWVTVVRGQVGGGGIWWQQPFSQSGLTRTEPCVAGKTPWKRYEHLAEFSTAPVTQSAVDIKAACRYKGVFSFGGAHKRMRSRGSDPAQLQPRSHTGTLQFAFSSVFFFSKGGNAELHLSCVGWTEMSRPLSAGHGFLEGHSWFRRPSHVLGAKTRVSGHLNYLQEAPSVPF